MTLRRILLDWGLVMAALLFLVALGSGILDSTVALVMDHPILSGLAALLAFVAERVVRIDLAMRACPNCGKMVYQNTEICPKCGRNL